MPPRTSTAGAPIAFYAQPLETQLSPSAFLQLENLKKSETTSQNGNLRQSFARAADLVQKITASLNDRAADERTRRQERLAKLRRDGNEETPEAREQHEHFQKEVEVLTQKMDDSIRKIVDQQHWIEGVPNTINHIIDKSKETQNRARRQTQNEDEDLDENDEEQTQLNLQPNSRETPSALLHAAQTVAKTEWSSKSLTDRYSQDRTYAQFYEIVWDAQNPGEHRPPMPHHSLWFAAKEGRNPTSSAFQSTQRSTQRSATQNHDEPEEDDAEMQVMDENVDDTEPQIVTQMRSTKCPLTLHYFEEPVTSTKCPHSFERSAVAEFIRNSAQRVQLTAAQIQELDNKYPQNHRQRPHAEAIMRARNPKHARCPEAGCAVWLAESDLRPDPVLARMVKRAKEADKREQEADQGGGSDDELAEDSDDDLPRGTQRRRKKIVTLNSSPTGRSEAEARRRTLVKNERDISVVPNSQGPSRSQVANSRRREDVMDVDDEDNEDEG